MSLFNTKYLGMDNMVKRTKVTLTSAQILALNTTPITLLAAPSAYASIAIISIAAYINYNSVAYAGANALQVQYTNGAGNQVVQAFPTTFLNAAANQFYLADAVAGVQMASGAPIVASVPTANPTAGNSTITFDILYRTVALP